MTDNADTTDRRGFLRDGVRMAGALGLVGTGGFLVGRHGREEPLVWQLDPDKCTACGKCATHCVLDLSAVKCVNCFDMCGYCDICTGYFEIKYNSLDTGAENEMCPTGAVRRTFIDKKSGQKFYEYTIDKPDCIGCGKCVKGCALMNGSLYLQVEHDRCLNCNECSIAVACPTQAFYRVPVSQGEILKRKGALALRSRGLRALREAGDDEERRAEAARLVARGDRQLAWRAKIGELRAKSGEPRAESG